jgi:hypothetical protein
VDEERVVLADGRQFVDLARFDVEPVGGGGVDRELGGEAEPGEVAAGFEVGDDKLAVVVAVQPVGGAGDLQRPVEEDDLDPFGVDGQALVGERLLVGGDV